MKTRRAGLFSLLIAAACAALLALPVPAAAEGVERSTDFSVEGAYYLPDHKGWDADAGDILADGGFAPIVYGLVGPIGPYPKAADEGRALGSAWGPGEIQAMIRHTIQIPFLAGSGVLTSGNNVAFAGTAALTPVSVRLELEATLTPIAFLNLYAGGMLGTGWDFPGLGDGLALNTNASGVMDAGSFEGVVIRTWVGGTFQFDLAARVPGEWTHVVTALSPKLQYAWFDKAGKGDAWLWEADAGENFNGWKLLGTWFLGYRMPLPLNTVGVLVETEQHLGYVAELSPMDKPGWGSDFVTITISPLLNFALSDRSSLLILFQFRRERLYSAATIFDAYYATREYVGAYWDFRRVAFAYNLKL